MKRSLALAAVLISSVLLPMAPAHADSVVVTSLPDDLIESQFSCEGSDDGSISFVTGPGAVPLGTGSLRLRADEDDQVGIVQLVDSLGSVSAWDVAMRSSDLQGLVVADVQTESQHFQLFGLADMAAGTWTNVDALNTELQVFNLDSGEPTGELSTIANWGSLGHGDGAGWVGIFNAPCVLGQAAPNDLYLDSWGLATNGGGVDPYDFEPEAVAVPVLTNKVSSTSITKGKSVKVSTKVTLGEDPVVDKKITLFAKPKGAPDFTKVGSDTTNAKGAAALSTSPKKTTVYRWRYAGETSPKKTVKVHANRAGASARTTGGHGLHISGLVVGRALR